jgi:hypothetical protein
MTEIVYRQVQGDPVAVQLRDPYWAALLAWLWPGAGHFYQRRFAKGFLFMICVLSTFFFGLGIGRGRVVYASFKPNDFRWHYICQVGVGLPAMPAVLQSIKTRDGSDPYFVMCERYPANWVGDSASSKAFYPLQKPSDYTGSQPTLKDGFMAPPAGPIFQDEQDVLGQWHFEMKHMFEIGTLYTLIAGLLNFLAIYDAFCGPAILTVEQQERLEAKKRRRRGKSNL